jgi:hypothetical protein
MLPTNSNDPFCAVYEVKSNRECSISRYSFEKKMQKICVHQKNVLSLHAFSALWGSLSEK